MEDGYAETNVGEIARRAGASKQTLYSRYPAKADLFKACIIRMADKNLLGFTKILVDDGPVEEVLQRFGLNLLEVVLLTENQLLRRAILGAIRNFPGLAEFYRENGPARAHGILADYLRKQVRLRNLRIADSVFAAELFCSMCVGPFMFRIELNLIKVSSQRSKLLYIREVIRVFTAAYFANATHGGCRPRQTSSDGVRNLP
jgi:AcrR family transcriptional regulator